MLNTFSWIFWSIGLRTLLKKIGQRAGQKTLQTGRGAHLLDLFVIFLQPHLNDP